MKLVKDDAILPSQKKLLTLINDYFALMRVFQPLQTPKPTSSLQWPLNEPLTALEIGCGVGLHPVLWAQANPGGKMIAIDKSPVRFEKFIDQIQQHKLTQQIYPVHANAISFISHCVPKSSVDICFLLYPNPYPKQRQANKRWHRMPFMEFLLSRLVSGGKLIVATNLLWYAQEAKEWLCGTWGLHLQKKTIIEPTSNNIETAQTHFEKKYLQQGQRCYQLTFEMNIRPSQQL